MTLFEKALVAHLAGDWLFQNEWMAVNKRNLRHPAGWVHTLIHVVLLGLALGWLGGVVLGTAHLLIDTGKPINWWIKVFKKCDAEPHAVLIRIATDQVLHIVLITAWVVFVARP